MVQPIKDITIVGGGTTGWLSALYLANFFSESIKQGRMSITVIESSKIGIIGVGESLSPSMTETLKGMSISEKEFVKETDASFKLSGYFVNWSSSENGSSHRWINPFIGYLTAGYQYESFEVEDHQPKGEDYASAMTPCPAAIDLRKAPRKIGDAEYSHLLRYAYHTDATKFAPFLMRHAKAMGVKHVIDDVVDAQLDEKGFIKAINLAENGLFPVEFVIDATGFSSVLLHQKLGVQLVDYSKHLINDRAVVAQLSYGDEDEIEPATRSTALKNGWAFRVPLYSRTGNGYVYSSRFTSDDEAAHEFVEYLGCKEGEISPRVIKMRVGRAEQPWVKNCVALGLAAGFVEPLEASAIFTVETSLKWLVNYFPTMEMEDSLARRYNKRVQELYDEIVDYIVLHYHLSNRSDTAYWQFQAKEILLPDRLKENLEVWKHALPVRGDFASANYFDHNTYIAALFGKGFYKGASLHPERRYDQNEWLSLKKMVDDAHRRALKELPGHRELLTSLRA